MVVISFHFLPQSLEFYWPFGLFFSSGNGAVSGGSCWCPCTCPVFVLVIVIILLQIVLVTVSPVWQRPDGGISLEPTQTLRPTQ